MALPLDDNTTVRLHHLIDEAVERECGFENWRLGSDGETRERRRRERRRQLQRAQSRTLKRTAA